MPKAKEEIEVDPPEVADQNAPMSVWMYHPDWTEGDEPVRIAVSAVDEYKTMGYVVVT